MKINILGIDYKIIYGTEDQYPQLADKYGYCDISTKEIVVSDMKADAASEDAMKNITVFRNKVVRHEIVHAMLYESGLHECSSFGMDEELVDWIAIQAPKMKTLFEAAGVL